MNALGFLGLMWEVLKIVISNEFVNKAMDNWVKGTSNAIDDMVWKLLEQAAGIEDHDAKEALLIEGLAKIEAQYRYAKESGGIDSLKVPIKTWDMTANVSDFANV